jgi:hypothetical protein
MATTNTTNFSVTSTQIIEAALRLCGRLGAGATLQADDLAIGVFQLNLLVKDLAQQGYQIFSYKTISHLLPANTVSFTIGPSGANVTAPKPVRITQAWVRTEGNFDTPLMPLSRSDYNALSNKLQAGDRPVSYFYDAPVVNGSTWNNLGTVFVWQPPQQANVTIFLSYQAPIQDVAAGLEFELPQDWFRALQWMLADELSMQYSVNAQKVNMIHARAVEYREAMSAFNQEVVPVTFTANLEG